MARAGLRERTKRVLQAEIATVAIRLFLNQGFEATTMEQIATEVGISRRSLFRYFGSKEDIVLGHLVRAGHIVKDALEARNLSEPPWKALRAALEAPALYPEYSAKQTLAVSKMLYGTSSLRAGHLEKQRQWQALLVPNIVMRLGVPYSDAPDLRAQAIVACALTCLDVATEVWALSDGKEDLGQLFDQAVTAVRG